MIVIISKGNLIKFVAAPLGVLALGFGLFNGVFFYNEAGFMTHVRTIFGDEKIVDDVGYATKWFGRHHLEEGHQRAVRAGHGR